MQGAYQVIASSVGPSDRGPGRPKRRQRQFGEGTTPLQSQLCAKRRARTKLGRHSAGGDLARFCATDRALPHAQADCENALFQCLESRVSICSNRSALLDIA